MTVVLDLELPMMRYAAVIALVVGLLGTDSVCSQTTPNEDSGTIHRQR